MQGLRLAAAALILLLLSWGNAAACEGRMSGGMCRCADGRPTAMADCSPETRRPGSAPRRDTVERCGNTNCPSGYHCSTKPGRSYCVKEGFTDCGGYSCEPGKVCGTGGSQWCMSPAEAAAAEKR